METTPPFYEIYDRHYSRVRGFIAATVKGDPAVDDLAQETFIRAHQNRESLKDPARFTPWLFRIAYNLCRDHFRSLKARQETNAEDETTEPADPLSLELDLERRQMSTCVQNQMMLLGEKERTILFLVDVAGFSYRDVGRILGIGLENVKVRLHRARRNLKALLEQNCVFEKDERNVLVCLPVADCRPTGP